MVEIDKGETIRRQKDILVSAFYGLSKAAKEASDAAIDFAKLIDLDLENPANDLNQFAEILKDSRNLLAASPNKREADDHGPVKKKKRATVRDPDAPKRPLTAYFAYAVDARKELTDQRKNDGLPPLSSNEMTTQVSEMWKVLDEASKERYKSKYKEKWDGYLEEKKEYETKKKLLTSSTLIPDSVVDNTIVDSSKLESSDNQKKKKEGHESKKEKKKKDKKKHRTSDIKDTSRHD